MITWGVLELTYSTIATGFLPFRVPGVSDNRGVRIAIAVIDRSHLNNLLFMKK